MQADLAALAYLVSGVLFILALRGLSSPVTSRTGNRRGMLGMAIAVATTCGSGVTDALTWGLILGGIAHRRHHRRGHRAAHPDDGDAAARGRVSQSRGTRGRAGRGRRHVLARCYGIGEEGAIRLQSLIEMSLGVAIGAITFAGSLIAFAKLNGNMSGAPILLPARHLLNILIFAGIVALVVYFCMAQPHWTFWAIAD